MLSVLFLVCASTNFRHAKNIVPKPQNPCIFKKNQGIITKQIPHRPVIVSHQVDAPLVWKKCGNRRGTWMLLTRRWTFWLSNNDYLSSNELLSVLDVQPVLLGSCHFPSLQVVDGLIAFNYSLSRWDLRYNLIIVISCNSNIPVMSIWK